MKAVFARLWRIRALRYLGPLLLLIGAYSGLHAVAENAADRISVTVWAPEGFESPSRVVLSRTIDDFQTAQQAQAAVNSTRLADLFGSYSCPLASIPQYSYHIEFRFHGILVEVADVDLTGCEFWSITTLGLPPVIKRLEPYPFIVLPTLHQLTGMPIPQP